MGVLGGRERKAVSWMTLRLSEGQAGRQDVGAGRRQPGRKRHCSGGHEDLLHVLHFSLVPPVLYRRLAF